MSSSSKPTPDLSEDITNDEEGQRLRRRAASTKRHLHRVRLSVRILHIPISITSLALMADTLAIYYNTINVAVQGQSLWPPSNQTMLWPTYLTLVSACISVILAIVVLVAYYWSKAASDRMDNWRSSFGIVALIINLILAGVVGGTMYSTGQATGPGAQSLWRVACDASNLKNAIFSEFLDLGSYCIKQNLGAYLAFVSIGTEFLSLSTYIIDYVQKGQEKKVKRHNTAVPAMPQASEEQGAISTKVDEKRPEKSG